MFYFILRVSSVNKILEIELLKPDNFREDIHQKFKHYANFDNTGPRIFIFVSASLNCPDFLLHIIIVSGPNFITGLISI